MRDEVGSGGRLPFLTVLLLRGDVLVLVLLDDVRCLQETSWAAVRDRIPAKSMFVDHLPATVVSLGWRDLLDQAGRCKVNLRPN